MNASLSQPTATTYSVVDLYSLAHEGRLRVPAFQRPLRWQLEDVRRFFDSIVKGYPVGNLLLWKRKAAAGTVVLGGLRIPAPGFDEALWVVDGQQRLTSLANALSDEGARDARFRLFYDFEGGQFVDSSRDDSGFVVPLPVLFDLQRLIRWFSVEHTDAITVLDQASRITRALREYQIPAYLVSQEDETILRDIFDRLNSYGRRLSRAEVFSALHFETTGATGEAALNFDRIAESVNSQTGFGQLDGDTVLRAVLARRGGDVTRDIRSEFDDGASGSRDFREETPEVAYREGGAALQRAVTFLQEDAGVPHFAFLAYRYLVVVLARFFAHFPAPQARARALLRRWYWRAAAIGPGVFALSWTQAMRALSTRIRANDESGSVQRLLEAPISAQLALPSLAGFRTNTAASRMVLCALWALKPRSLVTGDAYGRPMLSQALQAFDTPAPIVPRIVAREPGPQRGLAANRILMLEEDEPEESLKTLIETAEMRLGSAARDVLSSHAIDAEGVALLRSGNIERFLEMRQERMAAEVRSFFGRVAEPDFEDTPPLDSLDLDDVVAARDDETD